MLNLSYDVIIKFGLKFQISNERSGSIGLFKTPSRRVGSAKNKASKVTYKCNSTKKKSKKLTKVKRQNNDIHSFELDTSQEDQLPGYSNTNVIKYVPSFKQECLNFSEFDNYSFVVETAVTTDMRHDITLNFACCQNSATTALKLSSPDDSSRHAVTYKKKERLRKCEKSTDELCLEVDMTTPTHSKQDRQILERSLAGDGKLHGSLVDTVKPGNSKVLSVGSAVKAKARRTTGYTKPMYASTPQALSSIRPSLKQSRIDKLSPVTTVLDGCSLRHSDALFESSCQIPATYFTIRALNDVSKKVNLSLESLLSSCERTNAVKNQTRSALTDRNVSFLLEKDSKLSLNAAVVHIERLKVCRLSKFSKRKSRVSKDGAKSCLMSSSFQCPTLTADQLQQSFMVSVLPSIVNETWSQLIISPP